AVEPPLVPDGHVHHGRDAVHFEIGRAQFTGAGIGARVVRRDDTVFRDRREVAWTVARRQVIPGRVSTFGADKAVFTHDRGAVGQQPPDAGPFDVEGDGRRFGDGAERLGYIRLVALGQIEEHLLPTA